MVPIRLLIACLIVACAAPAAQAQHRHGWRGYPHSPDGPPTRYWSITLPMPYFPPVACGFSSPGMAFPIGGPGSAWSPVTAPPAYPLPTVSVRPIVHPTPVDPNEPFANRPARPTSPAGRLKSLEHQARGDQKLRKHLWAQAYMSYRSAIDAAGDRGEARFRQGFTYTAMQYYSSAVREFKRGLALDGELAVDGIRLAMLFGPGSEIVRGSILHKVAEWVRENPRDPDRLFLLGLMLHYEDDPRCRQVLQAARKMAAGDDDHIVALLLAGLKRPPAPAGEAGPAPLAELPPLPDAAQPAGDLAVPAALLELALPPLSDVPVPPVIARP